jgi:hypothetical protein
MSTTPAPLPEPEEILRWQTPLLRLLVAALLQGARHARAYADWQDETVDRTLAPALVRKEAKRFLSRRTESDAATQVSDEEVEFEPEYLPNLGVAVAVAGLRVKLLKSDNGNLPVPGPSQRRQQFYAQQWELFSSGAQVAGEEGNGQSPRANLVMHWVPDEEYNLVRVYLACPTAGGTTRASVESAWDEVIWRRESPSRESANQTEANLDELDIRLDEPQAESGTGG